MSITISITNNFQFCKANGLVVTTLETRGREYGIPDYEIHECPFELNLANGNFAALWSALGLEVECCGTIDAHELAGRLNNLKRNLRGLTSQGDVDAEEGRCTVINVGRSMDQVTRYYWELRKIVTAALERNEEITWG